MATKSLALSVQTHKGLVQLELQPNDNIARLKEQIAAKKRIPIAQQRIEVQNILLQDRILLQELDLSDDLTIQCLNVSTQSNIPDRPEGKPVTRFPQMVCRVNVSFPYFLLGMGDTTFKTVTDILEVRRRRHSAQLRYQRGAAKCCLSCERQDQTPFGSRDPGSIAADGMFQPPQRPPLVILCQADPP